MRKKDTTIEETGKGLRRRSDEITREPLPRRWVDLIRRLNEKERESEHVRGHRKLSGDTSDKAWASTVQSSKFSAVGFGSSPYWSRHLRG